MVWIGDFFPIWNSDFSGFFRLTLQEKHWTQKLFETLTILWMLWMPMEEMIWRPMHHICLRIKLCVWLHQLDSSIRIPWLRLIFQLSFVYILCHGWEERVRYLKRESNSRLEFCYCWAPTAQIQFWKSLESILSASETKVKSGVRCTCHSYFRF